MAIRLCVITLALAALLAVDREVPVSAGKLIFSRMPFHTVHLLAKGLIGQGELRGPWGERPPGNDGFCLLESLTRPTAEVLDGSYKPICEHMTEPPDCPQTPNLVCGTDGITYNSECHLCLTRIETKKDIQIIKDGKC